MYQFIETIYWRNDEMPLLYWHEQRFAKTQMAHFGKKIHLSLSELITLKSPRSLLHNQVYKIRVLYTENDVSIEFQPYQKKEINRLHVVGNDTIDYSFKYSDRASLEQMRIPFEQDEEIVIVKDGLLTDTSFTNIALFDGEKWQTPKMPLLEGTQRAFLLEQKTITPAPIAVDNLHRYTTIRLFNAMVSWDEAWELPITSLKL